MLQQKCFVELSGFSIEGFHSYGSSVEHLDMSEIEDILSATLVNNCHIVLYRVLLFYTLIKYSGGFRGRGKGSMPPRRQKSLFALLNYSFTGANDACLYPLSMQLIALSIQSNQSIPSAADC